MIAIGNTIKRLRTQNNVSQREMANKLNVSCQAISKWEKGNTYPDITMLPFIADFFHVTIDTLFSGVVDSADDVITESSKVHLDENREGWNHAVDADWAGTILPEYGPYTPTEDKLKLFDDLQDKSVLELACGNGKSLVYIAEKGARELYGLDISEAQILSARQTLNEKNIKAELFISPMELNPGIPLHHFDCVYSIYGVGWAQDIDKVFGLVSKYLKPKGSFIFSWDNPILPCMENGENGYVLSQPYVTEMGMYMKKFDHQIYYKGWKISSYINSLINAGFEIERMIEESDNYAENAIYTTKYYSEHKARYVNHSIIIKARKK